MSEMAALISSDLGTACCSRCGMRVNGSEGQVFLSHRIEDFTNLRFQLLTRLWMEAYGFSNMHVLFLAVMIDEKKQYFLIRWRWL